MTKLTVKHLEAFKTKLAEVERARSHHEFTDFFKMHIDSGATSDDAYRLAEHDMKGSELLSKPLVDMLKVAIKEAERQISVDFCVGGALVMCKEMLGE
jgi:hypothetical protein